MNIALIGYGKMGMEIEKIALSRGHHITGRFTKDDPPDKHKLREADTAIDFSTPESAVPNIEMCFDAGIPIVTGTTGWYNRLEDVRSSCKKKNGTLLYASNCSPGVNILFQVNKHLAELMNVNKQYEPSLKEIHHTQKKDAPSGTAITLATDILDKIDRKKSWESFPLHSKGGAGKDILNIYWKREGDVKGIHEIDYVSSVDRITLKHEAFSREGFALGAVLAAEWLKDKKGFFTMHDMFDTNMRYT